MPLNWWMLLGASLLIASATSIQAQDAKQIVEKAVQEELTAGRGDHSNWRYRDEERDGTNSVSIVVETAHGSVKKVIERGGRPLSEAETQAEEQRVESFIHNDALLRKKKHDGEQDDKSAEDLLKLLPRAFLWTVRGDVGNLVTLDYKPDVNFTPPDMKSRVLSAMAGELVVDKKEHRIRTIKGRLTEDVLIGWGILGKLREGGTFDVERREVAPGIWQIVDTHVHISGRALFFKTIGEQQDEIKSQFSRVPDGTTLEQAVKMLSSGG